MEVVMPLVAIIVGALAPVIVSFNLAHRDREEQELAWQHRPVRVVEYYRPGMRRTQDF